MMRKSMFAALLVLIMMLGGCSDVSTAPTRNDESELVTETEAAAEAESTKSIYSSESNESQAPKTSATLETAAKVTEREPVQSETVRQTEPVKQSEAETPATEQSARKIAAHRGRGLPVCVDSRILRFPLSTPHPLTTAKTIREKNICKYRTNRFVPLRTSAVFRIMKP